MAQQLLVTLLVFLPLFAVAGAALWFHRSQSRAAQEEKYFLQMMTAEERREYLREQKELLKNEHKGYRIQGIRNRNRVI